MALVLAFLDAVESGGDLFSLLPDIFRQN
jgi:hypothetical protein